MKFKGLLIAGAAITMALGMAAMVGCGSGTDYTFEAEKAQLSQNADGVAVYQSAVEYSAEGEGAAVEIVGYFTAADANIVWKITSDKECDATLTLRAASASADGAELWTGGKGYIKEMDLSTDTYVTLDVNGTKAKIEGKLPGLEFTPAEDFSNFMDFYGSYMNNYAEVTAKIHLKAGENTITLKSLGYTDGAVQYGINVDKITINASATLTWTETDNTDRLPPAMG